MSLKFVFLALAGELASESAGPGCGVSVYPACTQQSSNHQHKHQLTGLCFLSPFFVNTAVLASTVCADVATIDAKTDLVTQRHLLQWFGGGGGGSGSQSQAQGQAQAGGWVSVP